MARGQGRHGGERTQSELVMRASFFPAARWSRRVRVYAGSTLTKRNGSLMISSFIVDCTCALKSAFDTALYSCS